MRITLFAILALLGVAIATAVMPEQKADTRKNANELLSTLQELHRSLVAQITEFDSKMPTSETMHLVQHYTAQKNNIEREISLIQSIEASPREPSAPRHILKNISSEKSVPGLLNIFKKTRNPNNDDSNDDTAFSLPYSPYYVSGYVPPQYPYHHHPPPPRPDYPYPNDLIQNTFPGYPPQHNTHQTFTQPRLHPEEPTLQVPSEHRPPPQTIIQPEVQPPRSEPLYQPHPQIETEHRPQPERLSHEVDTLKDQEQPQYGQKQGVFIYYPNAVITEDDDKERPSIGDRFGQAFDRFGQVISNLANRPNRPNRPSRNPEYGSDGKALQKSENPPKPNKPRNSRPRSSSGEKVKPRELEVKRPKLRWVSV